MRIVVRVGLFLFMGLVVAAAGAGWFVWSMLADLPRVASLRQYDPPTITTVTSRDGERMGEFFEERRRLIGVDELPDHVVHAFLAAEDSQFFSHEGIDIPGILRAAWANLREGRVVQGGSTITQQVAKSLLLTPERSLRRKIREAILALRIERNLSKDEILHLYLNQIYLGHRAYGVESASEIYFGISARKLSLAQASLLGGLPQAPSRYDPYRHPQRATQRRDYVLQRMVDEGWASPSEAAEASETPLELAGYDNPTTRVSPYFTEHVRRLLEDRYGAEAVVREGYRVVTTMDARLQRAARAALRRGLEALDRRQGYQGPTDHRDPADPGPFAAGGPPAPGEMTQALVLTVTDGGLELLVGGLEMALPRDGLAWALGRGQRPADRFAPGDVISCRASRDDATGTWTAKLAQPPTVEGALVCLDPATGEVLALVGGYDFGRSQFNRATQARRQPGSAIKPLIYAAAIQKSYTPATVIYDTPIVYDSPDLDAKWKPRNYSKRFYGATTLRDGLVHSRNVITVKVLRDIGIPYVVGFLRGLGLQGELSPDLSLALGSPSMSPLELVDVYSTFPAGGLRHDPEFFLRIEDKEGHVLDELGPRQGERTLPAPVAYVVTDMMRAVVRSGTGRRVRKLGYPTGGKTGTTNDNRDAWFIGFTPDLVTGVWVGYDDSHSLGRRETGGRAAAPIWLDFMQEAMKDRPKRPFPVPEGIEFARIDAETGHLAGPDSKKTFTAAFLAGTVPEPAAERQTPGGASSSTRLDPRDPGAMDALR